MCYIFGFKVDTSEPSNVPRKGNIIKALVASVRIIAYKMGKKYFYYPIMKLFF